MMYRLITFRISHYCEKVRWALDRLGIPYIEECHLPLLHWLKTRSLGGSSVPILVADAVVLKDSADILNYLDEIAPPDLKLYPNSPELQHEIEELEAQFNCLLGVAIRQFGYFHVLPNQNLMQQVWCEGVPAWEKFLFPIVFPITRRKVYRGYHVNRESSLLANHQIQNIFEEIGDRLADGRKYLVGDRFSAADLTFACLSAPAILPPEYGGLLPEITQLPDEMAKVVRDLRETVAGKYVLRLYREERHVTGVIV
jgi:glutathione S-transferase